MLIRGVVVRGLLCKISAYLDRCRDLGQAIDG